MILYTNVAWMLVGQVAYAGSLWGLLVVLARSGGPEAVGSFTLALAIVAPVIVLSQLQMRQIQVADVDARYPFTDYLSVRISATTLALLVIIAFAISSDQAGEVAPTLLAVGLLRAVEGLSDIYYGVAQRHQRFDLVSRSMMLRGTLGLAAHSSDGDRPFQAKATTCSS